MLMRIVKYVTFAANLCVFCAATVGLCFGVFALVDGDAVTKLFAHVAEGFEVWTMEWTVQASGVSKILRSDPEHGV